MRQLPLQAYKQKEKKVRLEAEQRDNPERVNSECHTDDDASRFTILSQYSEKNCFLKNRKTM